MSDGVEGLERSVVKGGAWSAQAQIAFVATGSE